MVAHPDQALSRMSSGGFAIESAAGAIRAEPSGSGWRIDGVEGGWTLEQADAIAGGFVLRAAGDRSEAGRTMPLVGASKSGPRFLLLDDGRLFRISRCGPRDDGFELLGWEVPGAYVRARPRAQGWTLAPTGAAGGLKDINVLSILFAAEILDAEGPLRPVTR